ncbi:MAG: IS21 family transposase [Planctomycetes bacterium]|nr:IS21 family transposase [Planctomycetota bacterium]
MISWIDGVLEADRAFPRKQRHTAHRIWRRLRDEQGFVGGASTVREYVHEWKKFHGPSPAVFVPIDHPPGRDAEVDWGEAQAVVAGVPMAAQLFVGRLSSSGKAFVMAFPHQRQEAFFTGHAGAFAFWGGVPHRLRYDNLKAAVLRVLTGRKRQEQQAFIAFRSHHLYEASFCTAGVRGAHEKGGVEGAVGYARRNFFVPIPVVDSFEHLNALLLGRLIADGGRIPAGKSESIDAAFDRERPLLLPLPHHPYDCCRRIEARVSSSSLVTFEGNRYSVPVRFAFRIVSVKAYVHEVHIVAGDAVVARHPRRYGHGEESLDPLHYLPILARSPGAFEFGKPFQGWTLPPAFDRLRVLAGPRALIRVLQEVPSHGLDAGGAGSLPTGPHSGRRPPPSRSAPSSNATRPLRSSRSRRALHSGRSLLPLQPTSFLRRFPWRRTSC